MNHSELLTTMLKKGQPSGIQEVYNLQITATAHSTNVQKIRIFIQEWIWTNQKFQTHTTHQGYRLSLRSSSTKVIVIKFQIRILVCPQVLEGTHIIITTRCTEVQTREVPRGLALTPTVTRHTNRAPLSPHNQASPDPSTIAGYQGPVEEPVKKIGEAKESSIGGSESRKPLIIIINTNFKRENIL